MSDDRKPCPNCGHYNRQEAKHCTRCGFSFFLAHSEGMLRKRCTHCGFFNRMGANVCTQCGSKFDGVKMVTRGRTQKWCPQCGMARREGAKVCSRCGYRFKQTPVEPPIVQSGELAQPTTPANVTPALIPPAPPTPPAARPANPSNYGGEPAPYLSKEELAKLQQMGRRNQDVFVRLFRGLRDDK